MITLSPILNLYILSFNKITLMHDVLSLKEYRLSIPSLSIERKNNETLEDLLSVLFETYVDLSSSFITYKLCDAVLSDTNLILSYFCIIPFGTKIKNSFLLPSKDYANHTKNLPNIIRSI